MSSELIPVTQMEIKHLSHFFEDLPLNSVQKSLTRTIFNKTDNFYNQNEDVEDFFQHNICEKDPPPDEDEDENQEEDSEPKEEPKDDKKVATFESSSLGFTTNSFYKKKNEIKNNLGGNEGKKESKSKSRYHFDKFDYYHFPSSKKYFNYKYPKLPPNDSSPFLTGMSANLEKRREKILRNTKGLEDCLFNQRERKEREDDCSFLPPSSRFRKEFVEKALTVQRNLFVQDDKKERISKNLKKLEILRETLNSTYSGKLWVSPFKNFGGREEGRVEGGRKEGTGERRNRDEDGTKWRQREEVDRGGVGWNREIGAGLFGIKGKTMNTFQKEENNLNNLRGPFENFDKREKSATLANLTNLGSSNKKERSSFLKGKAFVSDNNQKMEIFNEYQKLIAISFKKANFPIKKGRVSSKILYQFYPFLAQMGENAKNRVFEAFGFVVRGREVDLSYESFAKFFRVIIKEEEGEECVVFWAKYFEMRREDGGVREEVGRVGGEKEEGRREEAGRREERGRMEEEKGENYVYKKDLEDLIRDFRREGFANKKIDEIVKKIKFDEGKIKEREFERWLQGNKYFTELMLCLMKRM